MSHKNMLSGVDRAILELWGYKIQDRTLADIRELCVGVYSDIVFNLYGGSPVYSGATHNPSDTSEKRPHLTLIKNLPTVDGIIVMGSTMGHHQENDRLPIMEVYEFREYGAMLVDVDGKNDVDLYIAKFNSKVLIPSRCNMTIYNLSLDELLTIDFANTYNGNNDSTKDLQKSSGPFMAVVYDGQHVEFRISPFWVNRNDSHGVKIKDYDKKDDKKDLTKKDLVILVGVDSGNFGESLYNALTKDEGLIQKFRKIGVNIIAAENRLVLDRDYGTTSLIELAQRHDKPLHKYFKIV